MGQAKCRLIYSTVNIKSVLNALAHRAVASSAASFCNTHRLVDIRKPAHGRLPNTEVKSVKRLTF